MDKDRNLDGEYHLEMILNPDRWPRWPYLPMKRSGLTKEIGFFSNYSIYSTAVKFYIGNIYDTKNAIPQDTTPEQAIYLGWRVD